MFKHETPKPDDDIQYCDKENVPLYAERRYEPIRTAYLLTFNFHWRIK